MDRTEKQFNDRSKLADELGLECVRQLFSHLRIGEEIDVGRGIKGTIREFIAPRDDRGFAEAAVDVRFSDYALDHIEISLQVTGWCSGRLLNIADDDG